MGNEAKSNGESGLPLGVRLGQLEQRVEELAERLDNAISSLVKLTQVVRSLRAGSAASASPAGTGESAELSPRMLEVVRLILAGSLEEAQGRLQAIPAEERNAQPAVVALAAAAMCLQRGDYATATKALERARSFSRDPRLDRVLEKVAERAQAGA